MRVIKSLLHPIWRQLPVKFRRGILERFTQLGVPSVHAATRAPLPLPITVAGYLTAATGLGQAARLAVLALEAQGVPVTTFDLTEALMHEKSVPFVRPKMRKGEGTVLMFVNPPVSSLALRVIGNTLLNNKHRIGAWIWELPKAPEDWRPHAELFHEIASASAFACTAIEAAIDRPVRLLIHPVMAEGYSHFHPERSEGSPADRTPLQGDPSALPQDDTQFKVGAIMDLGSRYARKNPFAVIAAYAQAFGDRSDAVLELKLLRAGAEPTRYAEIITQIATHKLNVRMILESTNRAAVLQWLSTLDVVMSLHCAEGFGLGCAEAMMMGVPCVATNWSATAEYIDESCGYPVNFSLAPAQDETGLYDAPDQLWAQANVQHAAQALRMAFEHPDQRAAKGAAAKARIAERFTPDAFCAQLLGHPTTGA